MTSLSAASRLAYLVLTLAAAWLFLWNLGAHSISLRSDEVIYVRVTQSILHNGDIFPLKHGGAPTFEKPPLKLWLGSIAPILLRESNLSFRLLDGLLGVLSVLLSVAMMRRISGSVWLALLSGALLLGMPELVISHHGFRRAVLDGLLTVLTILVASGVWRMVEARLATTSEVFRGGSNRERVRAIGIGALCSLAVLTKSVAGFVPALCAVVSLVIASPVTDAGLLKRIRCQRYLLWIVLLPVATFIGYCGALLCVAGPKALNIFIGVEVLTRVFSGFEGHNTGDHWFYLWSLFVRGSAVPRVLLVFGVLGALLTVKSNRGLRFLLVWTVLPVTLYSFSASKVPWYLNPFLPFMSMLAVGGAAAFLTYLARILLRILVSCRASELKKEEVLSASRYLTSLGFGSSGLGARDRFSRELLVVWCVAILLATTTVPAYVRAVTRHVDVVLKSNERIEFDHLVQSLRRNYSQFAIIENVVSGRSSPRNGRFNVEGIYREMLKPGLRLVSSVRDFIPRPEEVVLVKEESLGRLPVGWREIGAVNPHAGRPWRLVAVVYG
jgi:4-amino-4-deoxy-L-arabinose transferase-like glycosyltransferase